MWPAAWAFLLDAAFGAACGLGGLVSGKLGLRRIERMSETGLKMRRCLKCGAKVGVAARKCWSCRAYLPPTG
jgi:ribosomal protein L40E